MNKKIVIIAGPILIGIVLAVIDYFIPQRELAHAPTPGIIGSYEWCIKHGGKKYPTMTPFCKLNNIRYPGLESPN